MFNSKMSNIFYILYFIIFLYNNNITLFFLYDCKVQYIIQIFILSKKVVYIFF